MWIRKTSEEIAEAQRKRERTEFLWRINPLLPLVFVGIGLLFQSPETFSGSTFLPTFFGLYLFLYVVQFLFGPGVAAIFIDGNPSLFPNSKVAICPACQCVQSFAQAQGCEICGAALEPLEGWKWREPVHDSAEAEANSRETLRDVHLPDP